MGSSSSNSHKRQSNVNRWNHERQLESNRQAANAKALAATHQRDMDNQQYNLKKAKQDKENALARDRLAFQIKEANKPKPHKVWTGNRQKIQAALNEYKQCSENQEAYLSKAIEDKANCKAVIGEFEIKRVALQKMLNDFDAEDKLKDITTEVRGFKEKFEYNDKEVKAVINKTCVHSSKIGYFLKLTASIIPTVMQSVQESNNLNASLDTFYKLISRECKDKLTIDCYFDNQGLSRFVPTLLFQHMIDMEDMVCEDEQEYEEEILGLLQSAVKAAKEQQLVDEKENLLAIGLKRVEKKKLKKMCLKPDEWKVFQQQKSKLNKRLLSQCGPPLIKFFAKTHVAMSEVTNLLQIGHQYNREQKAALAAPPMKAITANVNDTKEDDVKYDTEELVNDMDVPDAPVDIEINNSDIARIANDNDIIGSIAISTINVLASMEEDFKSSQSALTFALNIQSTCGKLVRSQCNLRNNVALAMEIAKLKPAHLTVEAKKMWGSVDQGCIQIFKSAIDMITVSAQYFGFFLRFKDSFGRYMEAMEMDPDCSFIVSIEYLKKDLKDFMIFKDTYGKKLAQMNATAMKCIENCMRNAVGGQNFDAVQRDWGRSQEEYLESLKRLQKRKMEIDDEYLRLKNDESIVVAEIEKNDFLMATATDIIERIGQKKTDWGSAIASLQSQLEGASDYATEWKP